MCEREWNIFIIIFLTLKSAVRSKAAKPIVMKAVDNILFTFGPISIFKTILYFIDIADGVYNQIEDCIVRYYFKILWFCYFFLVPKNNLVFY